jgi:hypothetical protein
MYNAIIGRITNKLPHTKADRLEFIIVCNTNVITQKDLYEVGDLVVFFPSDGQLSKQYTDANDLVARYDENKVRLNTGYMDENRRVKAINLRGEKSDGLVAPISSLQFTNYDLSKLKEGEEFNTLNNILICSKYYSRATNIKKDKQASNQVKKLKTTAIFHEHVDTKQLRLYLNTVPLDSTIVITSKFHGSSGRQSFTKVTKEFVPYNIHTKLYNLANKFKSKVKNNQKLKDLIDTGLTRLINRVKYTKTYYDYVLGTRRVVLDPNKDSKGYYNTDQFRWDSANKIFPKLHKGEEIYYEIVGYVEGNQMIMPAHDATTTNDKEFIKCYGKSINYTYGCDPGESKTYVYRIAITNEDGHQWDLTWEQVKARCAELEVEHVPEIITYYPNHFTNHDDLLEKIQEFSNYPNPDGSFAEGVCIRIEKGNKVSFYKEKNWHFKVMEGIIKDDPNIIDMEEAES